MTTLNLITFASHLHKQSTIYSSHEVILTELEKYFSLNFVDYTEMVHLPPDDFSLVFIASGGVERMVMQHFELLPRPTVMLADGMQNSLAAALEISSWLRGRGMKSEILHGELTEVVKRIFVLYNNFKAQQRLSGSRIGVIGSPASWLIASNADYLLTKRRWGVEYTDISAERVTDIYASIGDDEVGESCVTLAAKALACRESQPEDLIRSMRLYRALKRIAKEEKLTALTVNCAHLAELTNGVTGCLALALLNDEGLTAGCEGDLQTIFTMLAVHSLTGKEAFMANPSMINTRTNELVLSHCTIGLRQTEQFILRSHFETQQSIGIQGILPGGDVTLVKCGSEALDEYYLATGTLTENTNYINMCRTQARIRLNSPVDYFLRTPLSNHHVMLQGNYATVIDEFFRENGCKRVE